MGPATLPYMQIVTFTVILSELEMLTHLSPLLILSIKSRPFSLQETLSSLEKIWVTTKTASEAYPAIALNIFQTGVTIYMVLTVVDRNWLYTVSVFYQIHGWLY